MTAHDKARVDVFVEKNNLNEASLILREKLNPFYVRIKKNDLNLSKVLSDIVKEVGPSMEILLSS